MSKAITNRVRTRPRLPKLFAPDRKAARRFVEFFAARIENDNTRRAYGRAAVEFAVWCEENGIEQLQDIQPFHIAVYVQALGDRLEAPSVKQHLAAIRMLFDWLVVGQVIATNPAAPVRGPKHSVKTGKTAVLSAEEARILLDSIPTASEVGLRDRALIGLMIYTFGRIGAALNMRVEDVYIQKRRTWVRLYEKGNKRHEMPCHHNLEAYLHTYIEELGAQIVFQGIRWFDEIPDLTLFLPCSSRPIGRESGGQDVQGGNRATRPTTVDR